MIAHIVLWDHLDGLSQAEKHANAQLIKNSLEALLGVVPGLVELKVYTEQLESSTCDIALYSIMESPEALKVYTDHPAHVKAATEVVRPRVQNRRAADYAL